MHYERQLRPNTRQVSLVYIGSSNCDYSKKDSVKSTVIEAKQTLSSRFDTLDIQFYSVGVAVDNLPEEGYRHLQKFGPFNEILTGGGVAGLGARTYIWNELPGEATTPQILIAERKMEAQAGSNDYELRSRTLLKRVVGYNEIIRWDRNGFIIPTTQ